MKHNYFFKRKDLNIDITYRCPLECLRCQRQYNYRDKGKQVPGNDLSIDAFNKITDHFNHITFSGQYSDPIHHPEFLSFLEISRNKNVKIRIHTASSYKPESWFIKAWSTNPDAKWVFAIDGLPSESHIYRKNQDGVKLFNIMCKSTQYLKIKPIWQFILFSYNEKHVDEAKNIARQSGVNFLLKKSGRWHNNRDWLLPKEQPA